MVNPVEPFKFPKNSSPVDAIAHRLQGWQTLATSLAEYSSQLADLNRSNSASNERLTQILNSCSVKPSDDAALTLLPGALLKLHTELGTSSRGSANSLTSAASQFRSIASDAQQRADNIRTYNQHFTIAQQVKEAQSRSQGELKHYQAALKDKDTSADPFVLKSRVDRALSDQVSLENKLLENYHTVQTLGAQYDEKIVAALNKTVRDIEAGFAASGTIQVEFCKSLKDNIFAPHADDFDQFIVKNKDSFITEDVHARELANARYDGQYHSASKAVRKGTLERRTKYLHSFVPADYVLTLGSLYEIKDGHRTLGIDLSDAELLEDHKHSTDDRFVLRARQQGSSSGKHHTWVFRTDDARKWAADLKKIVNAPPGQRAVAVFGSETYDPETEASTLSEKGPKAQVPSSLPANAPPADTASTAAVASGQTTPSDGAFPAGAVPVGATSGKHIKDTGATGTAIPAGATSGNHIKDAEVVGAAGAAAAGVGAAGASQKYHDAKDTAPATSGNHIPDAGVVGSTSGKHTTGNDLKGVSATGSAPATSGNHIKDAGVVGAAGVGAAGVGAAHKHHDAKNTAPAPATSGNHIPDAGVVGSTSGKHTSGNDLKGASAPATSGNHIPDAGVVGAAGVGAAGAGAAASHKHSKNTAPATSGDHIKDAGVVGAAGSTGSKHPKESTGHAVSGDFEGTSGKKYDPHGNAPDPAVPVHDAEFSTSKDTAPGTLGAAGAGALGAGAIGAGAAKHNKSAGTSKDLAGNPNATAGSIGAAGGAVSGGFEGTSNKSYDPHGKSNEPIVPVHGADFGSDTGVSSGTKEIKPSGAVDVNSPVERKNTQLGHIDTANKSAVTNSLDHPDIVKPRVGGAYKPAAAGAGAGTLGGAGLAHEHHNKNTEAVVPVSGNPRDSTTSSHYSKSAGLTGATSGAYDSDSASSVSDVEYSKDSPTELGPSTTSIVPPAHSAAWQAQQDLAAFDKKVQERDSAAHNSSAIAAGDADSQFSYDKKHRASTYTGEDYKPADILPPHVERKLTQTYHKYEDSPLEGIGAARTQEEVNDPSDKHFERRRSSISLNRKPSRNATASYGNDELKPLTNPDKSQHGKADLFFADELPASTSGNPTVPGPVAGNAKFL